VIRDQKLYHFSPPKLVHDRARVRLSTEVTDLVPRVFAVRADQPVSTGPPIIFVELLSAMRAEHLAFDDFSECPRFTHHPSLRRFITEGTLLGVFPPELKKS
jgi:hypothetical protein